MFGYVGPERASANSNVLGISFERSRTSSARAHSPFNHPDYSLSHRNFYSSAKDIHPPTAYASPVSLSLSYRSKSYHGELNRVTSSTYHGLSEYNIDLSRNERLQLCSSRSAYNINESYRNLYSNYSAISVNAYSKHYNHHNFWTPSSTPQPLNNRYRFQKRNAYKAHRSRSAYPLVQGHNVLGGGYQNNSLRLSRARITASQDFQSKSWTKSLFDIHSSQATLRFNRPSLFRYSSARSIFDDPAYAKSILNPDVYLRWLRSQRNMEDVVRRCDSKYYDNDSIINCRQRIREISYLTQSKSYISLYGKPYNKSPKFEKPIKGNSK